MKNYRKAAPLLLIGFIVLAIYSRVTELQDKETQYYNYIEEARNYREGKIYIDAFEQYQNALNMKNTFAVCEEIGEMFLEAEDEERIKSWGEYMIEAYPEEVAGYEYLIQEYCSNGQYDKCFSLYEVVQKRKLYSETLAATMNSIKYAYKLGNGKYEYVSEYVGEYCYYLLEGMYGYCTGSGKTLLENEYREAAPFCEELAAVQDENGEFYFIDIEGNRRMNVPKEIEVTKVGCFSENSYAVGTEGKMYYANSEGELILGPYEDATTFNYERAAVKEGGLWYLIDASGNKLSEGYLEFAVDEKDVIYRNNVIFAKTEEGFVCINGEGERITKQIYEDARMFLDASLAAVKLDGKWGFIDNTGNIKIAPQYEDAKSFRNNLAAVKLDGLWGYVDSDGVIAIAPTFSEANSFNTSGYTFVTLESGKWAILQLIGETY